MLSDKFTTVLLIVFLIGVGYLGYTQKSNQGKCVQMAISQNYAADQIKKICR